MPLFLQRSPTSSIKLQNKQEDEDQDNDQVIQAKFTVSESNDNYEQEADRIAEQVVSAPELVTSLPSCPICGESASCPNCSTKVATQIQRSKSNSEDESVSLSPALLETNAGEPLDNSTREYMEHRFGQNFGSIRIHNSTTDVVAAEQINARAFTHKHHVYFGAGHFQPETIEGKRLIAHELTHTIQQSGTVSATADIQKDEDEQQSQRTPDQIAQEIYNALDGWNNEHRAINALHGHNEGTRNQIQERFQSAHNQSVRSYLREQLDADWLVKAYALLQSSNWYEQHTAMALALIPLDTRDEEVFRILYGLTLEGRQRLEERYNSTFGELGNGTEKIGEGSLKSDLKDDLSGWRKEKSLALLNRDLTQADELYFDSVAITGTHTDSVISRLQAQWSQGPTVLIQLEADWDRYVRNQANWTDETWTDMTLYQAMNDELSGESWELVRSILRGLERYTNEVGVIVGPLTEEQNRTVEDIQIQVARESLTAATTGGYTGAGTNNEQVYQAISTIQRIYQVRIDRAPDASTRERLQQEWNDYQRDHLMPIIHSEMDEDTVEYKRTVLLLLGALTPADEVYLAKVEYDTDRTVNLVTRIWAQGEINQMLTGAQQPRRDGDRIVRPSFDTLFLVPVTSGLPYRRIQALTREGAADVSRGIARLHLELMEGTSDSDLQQAYALLTTSGISATLRSSVISRYVANYLSNETGDSDVRKFIAYIQNRYERSHTTFEFQDLLDPAATATEMLTRAEGRYQSAHSGVLNLVLQDGVQGYDTLTGEDTEQVTQESLQRLRFIVQHTGVNQQELQAMMAIAGVTDVNQLARSEYETFRQRLNELRSVRQAIVDAVVTAAQLALETAATILTAGAAGPALLASLSATIAGMVARELLLGEDYELVSRENAQQIALVFASHGFGALGRSAFVMPAEATRAQAFFYGAAHEAVSQMSTQLVTASFEGRMPTAEGIGISAVSILTHSAGAGMRNQITHTIGEHATDAQRLRRLVIANIVQNVVSSNTDEAANLARGGIGDLTGADIAGRFLHSSASGIGRGVVGGIGELGAHVVDRRRQQSQQDAESTPPDQRLDDDMHDPTGLPAQGRQSDRPATHAEPGVLAVHPVIGEHTLSIVRHADGSISLKICSPVCGRIGVLLRALQVDLSANDPFNARTTVARHLEEIDRLETRLIANPLDQEAHQRVNELAKQVGSLLVQVGEYQFFGTAPAADASAPVTLLGSRGEPLSVSGGTVTPDATVGTHTETSPRRLRSLLYAYQEDVVAHGNQEARLRAIAHLEELAELEARLRANPLDREAQQRLNALSETVDRLVEGATAPPDSGPASGDAPLVDPQGRALTRLGLAATVREYVSLLGSETHAAGSAGRSWDWSRFPTLPPGVRWQPGLPIDMPTENSRYPNYDPIGRGRYWQNRAFFERQARQRSEVTRNPDDRNFDPMRAATDGTLDWMLSLSVDEVRSPSTSERGPSRRKRVWELEHSGTQQQWRKVLIVAGFSASDANRLTGAADPSGLMEVTPLQHAFFDAEANAGGDRADGTGRRFSGTQDADERQRRPLVYMSDDALREIIRMIQLNPARYNFEQNDRTHELRAALQQEIALRGLNSSLP